MRPCIRVRFVANDTFLSKAIRRLTGSLFSHVEFGTPEGTWIGALAGSGIQERAANYCRPSLAYVYEVPCTQAQQDAALKWMRARIGTKYNYSDIVGLLFQARTMTSPSRLICSQFVTEGMIEFFGAERYLNVLAAWSYRITPETAHLSPIFVGRRVEEDLETPRRG